MARDANYVMEKVVAASRKNKLAGGRPAAGKTGTQQYKNTDDNAHAWMCGFTPQLATAVWVGNKGADGALKDGQNNDNRVYGSGIPGRIWKQFMDAALKGQEKKDFKSPRLPGRRRGRQRPDPDPHPGSRSPTQPADDPDDDPQNSPSPTPSPDVSSSPEDPDFPGDPNNPFPTPSRTRGPRTDFS